MERVAITELINKVYDAVDESKLGPIIAKRDGDMITWNTVPYQVLMQFIGSELPHISISTNSGKIDMKLYEPGDSWKK